MNWIKNNFGIVQKNSLNNKKQRQFGVLIVMMLLIIGSVSIYKEGLLFTQKQIIIAVISAIVLMITVLIPVLFYPFLFVWLFIGTILGEITSFIILGLVYYLLLSPVTIFLRIKNKKQNANGWMDKKDNIDYEKLY